MCVRACTPAGMHVCVYVHACVYVHVCACKGLLVCSHVSAVVFGVLPINRNKHPRQMYDTAQYLNEVYSWLHYRGKMSVKF